MSLDCSTFAQVVPGKHSNCISSSTPSSDSPSIESYFAGTGSHKLGLKGLKELRILVSIPFTAPEIRMWD